VGYSREITALVTLVAMGVAGARDATWNYCKLAARDPDRSIAARTKGQPKNLLGRGRVLVKSERVLPITARPTTALYHAKDPGA